MANPPTSLDNHDTCPCCVTRRRFMGTAAMAVAASAMTDAPLFAASADTDAATHLPSEGRTKMTSSLLPYECVPQGFEIVIGNKDVEMGRVWNLWFNVTLSDDPRKWDDDIQAVNAMQKRLDGLSDEQRIIRAHMAEFCRDHPSFPNSIDGLCEEIGTSTIAAPSALGCEGRGLLQRLGYHPKADVERDVRAGLQAVSAALHRWRDHEKPTTATERQVFLLLGEYAAAKDEFIDRLLPLLTSDDSIIPLREMTLNHCQATLGEVESEWRPFNCFNCLAPDDTHPMCKCSYTMLARAGLLCANDSRPDGPPEKLFRSFVEEHVQVYAAALNAWLSDEPRLRPPLSKPMASMSEKDAADIFRRIHKSLGEQDPVKTWLTASLLKTLVGRRTLSDDFPDATSWLKQ